MINNIFSYLIFNCLICDSRSLKCVLGYGLCRFSVVCGCLGVLQRTPQKNKSYLFSGTQREINKWDKIMTDF